MLLDNLKNLIKEFEVVLSKDIRFKEDMYFKNQVKIIYIEKEKIKNIFVPLMLSNLSKSSEIDEVTKLKNRIKYLEKLESIHIETVCPKIEPFVCPKIEPHDCSKCEKPVCPSCEKHVCPLCEKHVCPPCEKYERGELPNFDELVNKYSDVIHLMEQTASEEDELNFLYNMNNGSLKLETILYQINHIKQLLPDRVNNRSDTEIQRMISKYQN